LVMLATEMPPRLGITPPPPAAVIDPHLSTNSRSLRQRRMLRVREECRRELEELERRMGGDSDDFEYDMRRGPGAITGMLLRIGEGGRHIRRPQPPHPLGLGPDDADKSGDDDASVISELSANSSDTCHRPVAHWPGGRRRTSHAASVRSGKMQPSLSSQAVRASMLDEEFEPTATSSLASPVRRPAPARIPAPAAAPLGRRIRPGQIPSVVKPRPFSVPPSVCSCPDDEVGPGTPPKTTATKMSVVSVSPLMRRVMMRRALICVVGRGERKGPTSSPDRKSGRSEGSSSLDQTKPLSLAPSSSEGSAEVNEFEEIDRALRIGEAEDQFQQMEFPHDEPPSLRRSTGASLRRLTGARVPSVDTSTLRGKCREKVSPLSPSTDTDGHVPWDEVEGGSSEELKEVPLRECCPAAPQSGRIGSGGLGHGCMTMGHEEGISWASESVDSATWVSGTSVDSLSTWESEALNSLFHSAPPPPPPRPPPPPPKRGNRCSFVQPLALSGL
jgi:hypothetical protein